MGIASQLANDVETSDAATSNGEEWSLLVESGAETAARDQLMRYERENAPHAAPARPLKLHASPWIAPALYAFTLLAIAFLAGRNMFSFDWYRTGALSSSIQHSHQWWRAATALTLHVDHDHLLRNVGFGVLFTYAAARLLGSGIAFASAIGAAVLGNLLDSVLMPHTHVSIGASTIVFATLGLISAYSWRIQFSRRMQWAHRWAPLVIGIALLGFLGAGGENTDVLAHLTGFAFGVLLAILLAQLPPEKFDSKALQSTSAVATLTLIAAAWFWAAASYRSS